MNDSPREQSTALSLRGDKSIAKIGISPHVDLEDLRQGLKNLEHAVITNRLTVIRPWTLHVTYCVRTLLQTTDFLQQKISTTILQRFVKLARQRQRILWMLEALVNQSQNVLKEDIQEDELELETVNLLGSSEQILSLVQEFIYTAAKYGIHAGVKASSQQSDSIHDDNQVSLVVPVHVCSNVSKETPTRVVFTETTPTTLSLFHREHAEYNMDGTLLGATMWALVEEMTPHDTIVDQAFSFAFFLTFRLFSSPAELLANVIMRWNLQPPPNISEEQLHSWKQRKRIPVRLRVLNLIKTWIMHHWEPGTDDSVLPTLETFLREEAGILDSDTSKRISQDLLDIVATRMGIRSSEGIIGQRARGYSEPIKSAIPPLPNTRRGSINQKAPQLPAPVITRELIASLLKKDFGDIPVSLFDPLELARQLTIMESNLFCAVRPTEFIKVNLDSTDSDSEAKNMMDIRSLGEAITNWVSESMRKERDNKKFKRLTKFFLQVANCCMDLNNFATLRSILMALNLLDRARSRMMRSGLSQKQKEQFKSLNLATRHCRNKLGKISPPAIPIISSFTSDIISCQRHPPYIASTLNPNITFINFARYREIAKTVQDLMEFQVRYDLEAVPEIQQYLHHCILTGNSTESPIIVIEADNQVAVIDGSSSPRADCDPEDMSIIGVNPTIVSIYSMPSSRTASTDYGFYYTRHACSQDSFGYQWWADSPEVNPPPINV